MSDQSNIIPSLLRGIGFMAFILLIINAIFSDAPGSKSNKSSFSLTEVGPLILFSFGLLPFSVAIDIK
jgi:hypothetical protein